MNGKLFQKQKQRRRYHCAGSILAAAQIIVRLIGLFYRIPLQRIAGDVAMGYYGYAYDIYMLLLLVSSNGVLMAIRHLPKTLLLVVVLAAAVLGCYLFGLGIVFIPAVAALVDSLILESIFVQYMSKEDREKEALRNHPEQYEYYNRKE